MNCIFGKIEPPTIKAVCSANQDLRYHRPFQDAVHAGTGNIMCSYNKLNNSGLCQNSKALNGLLKAELGFQGFVVSDWDAQASGVGSALAGLDVAMVSLNQGYLSLFCPPRGRASALIRPCTRLQNPSIIQDLNNLPKPEIILGILLFPASFSMFGKLWWQFLTCK